MEEQENKNYGKIHILRKETLQQNTREVQRSRWNTGGSAVPTTPGTTAKGTGRSTKCAALEGNCEQPNSLQPSHLQIYQAKLGAKKNAGLVLAQAA